MLSTTYVSDSTLIAIVPSEITSTVGSYEVDVVNPTQDLDDTDAVVRFVVYQRQIKILPGNKTTTMSAPLAYELHQNYPNPFNPTTTINFDLARPSTVTLKVYNSVGQEVATLADNTEMSQGSHFSTFDASNLASGTYIYRLSVTSSDNDQPQSYVSVKRMTLVK
jgi:hypothetical protein